VVLVVAVVIIKPTLAVRVIHQVHHQAKVIMAVTDLLAVMVPAAAAAHPVLA
jgi:hypothetical protein